MTPFEVVYGRALPTLHNYEHGSTAVAQVEDSLQDGGIVGPRGAVAPLNIYIYIYIL